jgi:multiple sugar transport system ATP-binding protein
MGRAIVREPKVFLMDEPLSNLDAKLRTQMRSEISRLHRKLGTAFIYVTHDQTEAMTLGTNIVVMKDGEIQQAGTPLELYNQPANLFVAGFIGAPQMNFLDVAIEDGALWLDSNRLEISRELPDERRYGKDLTLGLRPKDVHVMSRSGNGIPAVVERAERLGSETHLFLKLAGHNCIAVVEPEFQAAFGDTVTVEFNMKTAHLFSPDGGRICRY